MKPSALSAFFTRLSLLLYIALSILVPSPPLPATFSILYVHSQSSHTQQRTARFPTSCHFRTHIPRSFPFTSKSIKQLPSTPLISFAYKHILKPQAQSYFTLTTQISYFALSHHATQFTKTLLPLPSLTDRTSQLWTLPRFWASSLTSTTFSFRCTTFHIFTRLKTPAQLTQASQYVL